MGVPPEKMTHEWIVRRIPQMDVSHMVEILLENCEDGVESDGGEIFYLN